MNTLYFSESHNFLNKVGLLKKMSQVATQQENVFTPYPDVGYLSEEALQMNV